MSVTRIAPSGPKPMFSTLVIDAFDRAFEGAVLGAVEAGGRDRGEDDGGRARDRRPVGGGGERPAAADPPVLHAERGELGEHPEVDREGLAAAAPLLDSEEGHHRQRVAGVDEGGDAGRVRVEADRDAAARAVDDLEPDEGEQADRRRPAAEPFRVAQVGGGLAGDEAEAGAGGAADRAPRVEGPEDVAEQGREEGEAEPDGDEKEGDREVAIGRFGPVDAAVGGDAEEEDAEGAAEGLGGRVEQRREVSQAAAGRQRSSSKRGLRQAAESAKKETIRTIEAAQAKSQAGIGRSCLATRACANGT